MKDRGIDALVNECLINPVLIMRSHLRGLCLLLSCTLISRVHEAGLQRDWLIHTCRHGLHVPPLVTDVQHLFDTGQKRCVDFIRHDGI